MRLRHPVVVVVGIGTMLLATSALGGATGPRTTLISKTSGGDPATGASSFARWISPTGRFVAFESFATNLPGTQGGTITQVYIRDRKTAKTNLISKTSGGDPADGGSSFDPSMSADGRFVAFESDATNLPGASGYPQVYVRDRRTGKTTLISKTSGGAPATGGASTDASISGSGRFVTFESAATNLPSALTPSRQVYLRDRKTGRTTLISKTSGGDPANADSEDSFVSRNGRFLGFESQATNLPGGLGGTDDQIYVRDRRTAKTKLVSRNSSGQPADDDSEDVMISPTGRFMGFESFATNLPGSIGPTYSQVYIRDRKTGNTSLVSKTSGGGLASGGYSEEASISDDGRFVAFESAATNLPGALGGGSDQAYVRDRARGKTILVSRANDGSPADNTNDIPRNSSVLTRDGGFVIFDSFSTNLPGAIGPSAAQVYIRGPVR